MGYGYHLGLLHRSWWSVCHEIQQQATADRPFPNAHQGLRRRMLQNPGSKSKLFSHNKRLLDQDCPCSRFGLQAHRSCQRFFKPQALDLLLTGSQLLAEVWIPWRRFRSSPEVADCQVGFATGKICVCPPKIPLQKAVQPARKPAPPLTTVHQRLSTSSPWYTWGQAQRLVWRLLGRCQSFPGGCARRIG